MGNGNNEPQNDKTSGMTFEEFYKKYRRRIDRYAAKIARMFHLPPEAIEDLRQACLIGVFKCLPYWRQSGGVSVFNWCARPMSSEMHRVVRGYMGYKPFSRGRMTASFVDYDAFEHNKAHDNPARDIERNIDLSRALTSDPKPAEIVRFIMLAMSPCGGADLARERGVSRQAIFYNARATRGRLRAALTEFAAEG